MRATLELTSMQPSCTPPSRAPKRLKISLNSNNIFGLTCIMISTSAPNARGVQTNMNAVFCLIYGSTILDSNCRAVSASISTAPKWRIPGRLVQQKHLQISCTFLGSFKICCITRTFGSFIYLNHLRSSVPTHCKPKMHKLHHTDPNVFDMYWSRSKCYPYTCI